jgi:uncharacterized protein (TIGR02588 family)
VKQRNVIEWAVLATSVVAIVALVGVLVIQGLHENQPANPRVELRRDESRAGPIGWIVPADVVNDGDEPAEAVLIEASAQVGGEEETSEIDIDYLPAGTTVEIAFAFSAEPEGEVSVRLVGFRVP